MKLIILLLVAITASAETVAANFSADLPGKVDTRPYTWGTEDSYIWPMRFKPDANVPNARIRIKELHGDLVAWPTFMGQKLAYIPYGRFIGVLVALHREDRWNSDQYCEFCNRDCLLYLQGAMSSSQPVTRIPFDIVNVDYDLGPDHTLYVKVASWLNDAGTMVHIEPTFTVKFETIDANTTDQEPD